MKEYICKVQSPAGLITLSSDGQNITGLWLEAQKYYGSTLGSDAAEQELPVFNQAREWLTCYFKGKEPDFMPPLAPKGSPFRQQVWKILEAIPYGSYITYKSIADEMERKTGKRQSAQAVGGAVSHNPISIMIPCHRVVSVGGSLTGYAGGIDKKIQLLKLEGVSMEGLFVPKKGTAL